MPKDAANNVNHFAWVAQMITGKHKPTLDEPGDSPCNTKVPAAGQAVTKSVSWHDINENQIEERDAYDELLRRLSISSSAREDLLFLFLQIFCGENQSVDFNAIAPRVDKAFSEWVQENIQYRGTLLLGESSACIRLARLERKLSHVLCLLTLLIKATVDPEARTLSNSVMARGFDFEADNTDSVPPIGKVLDRFLQLLLALWCEISAVKLQITTHYNYYKQQMSPKAMQTAAAVHDLKYNSAEALRLIVTKLPPS